MDSCIPLPIKNAILDEISSEAKDWALLNGVVMKRKSNFSENEVSFAPFTLLPSIFNKDNFHNVVRMQISVNELLHKVAHSHEFLSETMKSIIGGDDFTRRLYNIYETVRLEGFNQSISLGVLRTDYLINDQGNLKQVEMNTISCSFASLCNQLYKLHRFTLAELGHKDLLKHLPENNALHNISTGILVGWQHFGNPDSVILFLVEDETLNIADQRFIEFKIKSFEKSPKIIRRTLTYIAQNAFLNDKKDLIVDEMVVGIVYFRVGYDPSQYPTEAEWEARLTIERSTAIKCPNIQMHLAGCKKIQQRLAEPGVLEKFTSDVSVRDTFTGIYSLDPNDENCEQAVMMGISDPERFVLKPQREGGGHNVYGVEIKAKLLSMSKEERSAWILMERIVPPLKNNILVQHSGVTSNSVISELGIFGVVIGDSTKIMYNKSAGHMLRTKLSTVDEGGVAAGFGVLDSPFLV